MEQTPTDVCYVRGSISWARFRMRRAFAVQGRSLSDLPYVAPGYPYFDIFAIFACAVLALLGGWSSFSPADPIGLVGNYAGLIIAFVGFLVTKLWTKSKMVPLADIDLDTGRSLQGEVESKEDEVKKVWWRRAIAYIV
jgi:lysine-specific permease